MAFKFGQEFLPGGMFKICVLPTGTGASTGTVLDAQRKLIVDWSSTQGEAVWVEVGPNKGGFLTEIGGSDSSWVILHTA